MTQQTDLPKHIKRLTRSDTFTFSCHKDVKCFTECCRMLELALTPYDVLRLRHATGLTSGQLLDEYIIMEQDPGEPFPRFYLTMIDDGRASCVFVAPEGCTVYEHRPGACRTYPLGRAVIRHDNGAIDEHFVLMKEEHCLGYQEQVAQTALKYSKEQELLPYNTFNDAVAAILQHDSIRKGFIPTAKQIELFILVLYNIDTFRNMAENDRLPATVLTPAEKKRLNDDDNLLLFGISWLHQHIFAPF